MKKVIPFAITAAELVIGISLTAASIAMIVIPQGFVVGGVTGLARCILLILPVPLSIMVFILNTLLLLLGWLIIGKAFVAKTILTSMLFPVFLEFFSRMPLESLNSDPLLATIIAGLMLGLGAGLILRSGSSAGGFDTLAVVLNKKCGLSIPLIMNSCDAAVIILQAIGRPLPNTIYGIMVITMSSYIVGKIVVLGKGEAKVMIFSEHYNEIRQTLLQDLDAGLTLLNAESGYLKKEMKVIVTVIPYQKVYSLKQSVQKIDPSAFIVVDEVQNVLGKGYTFERRVAD